MDYPWSEAEARAHILQLRRALDAPENVVADVEAALDM
jgi:hypothetical protein